MFAFFKNKGPFDVNFILKNTLFTKKEKIKKKKIKNISSLENAKNGDIVFFDNLKYVKQLNSTNASFCFIKQNLQKFVKNPKLHLLVSQEPLIDFIIIAKMFYPEADNDIPKFVLGKKFQKLKDNFNTLIDKNVKIQKNFNVGLNTTIKKNVIIGKNVTIGSNCVISNAVIGDNVIINDGTVIGKIGFGFKKYNRKINFIPHIGNVQIGNDVYIGSNCTIDRGSFSNTVVGNGCMIDNQVHIAHNVILGSNCFIAGQTGIAGSTKIGNNCQIGGKTGISGHLLIGDNVHIGGQSGVLKNIKSNSKVMGYPSTSIKNFVQRMRHD